jgi:hypothetical protein
MRKPNYRMSIILTVFVCIGGDVLAYSGDGDGSPENPYQISTVEDWQELMACPNDWSGSFILTADINLAGVALAPIGNESTQFTGVFDGNDNIISNAIIRPGSDKVGLFGYIGAGSQIRNLGVEDVNIYGDTDVGGLVGKNSSGTLTSCYATGSVSGLAEVGGLVGSNIYGTLISCYAACSVSKTFDYSFDFGGLVGVNCHGTLTDCHATGPVEGGFEAGGLVGSSNQHSSLTSCYATGSVSAEIDVGGLVGVTDLSCTITFCYATGSVNGYAGLTAGGLVGSNKDSSLICCYSTGLVNPQSQGSSAGGLVGAHISGAITDCFWDIETSGIETSAGGTGKTTAEMKTLSTFTSAGWDFVEIWGIGENQTYPYLRTDSAGDLNHNKKVDFSDFAILAEHWLDGI